ncbi:conjugal transfer protein TraO [Pectobacterium atrosepticum]|uniref:conjugal transfer protein TraO n=1 Tax=Pectobacterium atrosepticum TaxID=29471 RepID=UPI0030195208
MSAEQDAGQNGKKLFSIIGLAALAILAGSYLLFSWWNKDGSGTNSAVNLNGTASSAGSVTPETPRYRELLKASNDLGASEAAREKRSFIASLPVGLDTREPTPEKRPAPPPKAPQPSPAPRQQTTPAAEQQASEKRLERLQKLLTRINLARAGGDIPVQARVIGATENVGKQMVSEIPTQRSIRGAELQQQLIPALTRTAGYLETAVDSDNPTSQVVAMIPTGIMAGARLHSPSVKLVGEGVEIHFTRMSWRGMELNVNAYAQRDDNLMSSVASDVNHRWGTHIILPAFLGGVGNVGSLYKDANTQVLQTNVSTVTGRVGKPDASSVAGVMLGGAAEKSTEVIGKEIAREPFRQVTVKQNEVISILFVDAVSTDDIAGNKNTSGASASPLTSSTVPTEQLSQSRLQEAIERRKAEIRRQYGDTEPSKE